MNLREPLVENGVGSSKRFRWRGGNVSRLEGFSDAVFGFSLTLLVISMEVPKTLEGLLDVVRGLPVFACCFTSLFYIWYCHYLFFRRYGLQDGRTHALNALLLFMVVFFVYPLKFLYSMTFNLLVFHAPSSSMSFVGAIDDGHLPLLFAIYGIGFWVIFTVFGLLYLNAYRQRKEMNLTWHEVMDTLEKIYQCFGMGAVGLLSVVLIYISGNGFLSGMIYCSMALVSLGIHKIMAIRRCREEGTEA